jgi:hypothetical protein
MKFPHSNPLLHHSVSFLFWIQAPLMTNSLTFIAWFSRQMNKHDYSTAKGAALKAAFPR